MTYAKCPRHDLSVNELFEAARQCTDAQRRGAILAVASLRDGMALTDAARIWRVELATLRDVIRRLDESGIDGLADLVSVLNADPVGSGLGSARATRRT